MTENTQPVIMVAVGTPGSGKSTWWEHGLKEGAIPPQSIRINMDSIRKELTGNESDQTKNGAVAKIAEVKLRACLSERIPVIYWDNTCTKAKYRKDIINLAKSGGYRVMCIFFNVPLKECLRRNSIRPRKVPSDIIERMHASIQENPPCKEEGFDDIIVINS